MKKLVRNLFTLLLMLHMGNALSQSTLEDSTKKFKFRDLLYNKEDTGRIPIPDTYLRQGDVVWSERIWREIDLREKINLPLYYPLVKNQNRECLWDVLCTALKGGVLTAYNFDPVDFDNSFSLPLTKEEIRKIIEPVDTLTDENGSQKILPNPVTPDKIRGYMIKEEWFFDKQRSLMDVRILGIAPMAVSINANTGMEDTLNLNTLFWIYFPEARPLFAVKEVFNTHNDAERRTYESIFWKRQFASFIIQASNVYNRSLAAYTGQSIERLLEGEKIKHKMFAIEHDMWQY